MARRKPTFGIGHRFAVASLAIGVALVAALVVVQTRGAKRAIRERARIGADVALEQTAALCRDRLAKGQGRALYGALLPLVGLQRFVSIDVSDPDGRPIVQLTHPERHRGFTQDPDGRRADDDVVEFEQLLADGDRALGTLRIGLWVRGINDDLDRITRHGWTTGLGLCALIAFLSWALGARLSRRLRRLTDEIQRRGPDDFSPLDARGTDEVAQLAGAFNRRQDRLREERARRMTAEAHRQDMVHMIVHDMKGPLSVFRSGMPLIRERLSADARLGRMAEMLSEGAGRLLRMAENILNVARVEDPDAPIEKKPVDLAALARARVDAAAEAGREKAVAVSLEAAQGLPSCLGDPDLLARVLDNLLLNAIEHTPKRGRVRVGLSSADGVLRLEVLDTGPGVPASERERVFEKFRKGRAVSGGAGLGLAFCRLAIDRHGGRIGVADGEAGRGARFVVELPLTARSAAGPKRAAGSSSSSAS
ncbi:MAG: HAMP domain-containing histidine kinase [Elusimicrobia bacterium]|nr:HAMP domain-containing histidine kinase [Elusimicrobiota bacterium]